MKFKKRAHRLNPAVYAQCERIYSKKEKHFGDGITQKQCFQCGKMKCIRKCGDCRSAFYCSAKCQKKHWPDHCEVCCQLIDDERPMLHKKLLSFCDMKRRKLRGKDKALALVLSH